MRIEKGDFDMLQCGAREVKQQVMSAACRVEKGSAPPILRHSLPLPLHLTWWPACSAGERSALGSEATTAVTSGGDGVLPM